MVRLTSNTINTYTYATLPSQRTYSTLDRGTLVRTTTSLILVTSSVSIISLTFARVTTTKDTLTLSCHINPFRSVCFLDFRVYTLSHSHYFLSFSASFSCINRIKLFLKKLIRQSKFINNF